MVRTSGSIRNRRLLAVHAAVQSVLGLDKAIYGGVMKASHFTATFFGVGLSVLTIGVWLHEGLGIFWGVFLSLLFFLVTRALIEEGS